MNRKRGGKGQSHALPGGLLFGNRLLVNRDLVIALNLLDMLFRFADGVSIFQ